MLYESRLAPHIFIFRALPMTPITSSPLVLIVPTDEGGGMIAADGEEVNGTEGDAAPTAAPHPPQNFVIALTGAPQVVQVFPTGCGGAEEAGDVDSTGVPENPTKFFRSGDWTPARCTDQKRCRCSLMLHMGCRRLVLHVRCG